MSSSQFIITVRFGRIQSFPISNDRRKIPNRGFVAVQEHDENCALLYGVFIFGEKNGAWEVTHIYSYYI